MNIKPWIMTAAAAVALLAAPLSADARTQDEIFKQAGEEINNICIKMKPFMDKPDKLKAIKVDKDPDVNAYAASDGSITFLFGMINFAQSEDEIAMICGHEAAHLSREHGKKSLGSTILATIVSGAVGGTAGDIAGNLIYSKNSRKHERESDREGMRYAWHAGYNPMAGIDLWQRMSASGGEMPLGKYMSTHPIDNERIENFKVQMVRDCKDGVETAFCDEILSNKEYLALFDAFQNR